MIKITVELCPHGDEKNSEVIGLAKIWNDTTGSKSSGNYGYKIFKRGTSSIWRMGEIKNFPRKSLTGWDLLFRILRQEFSYRNDQTES